MASPLIVWFRQDLRLADQPALAAAAAEGPVIPVYVFDEEGPGEWRMGPAQRWWLARSLARLDQSLRRLGSSLVLREGRSADELVRLAAEAGARRIHAVAHCEPWWRAAEAETAERLDLVLHGGNQLAPPESIRTRTGDPFRIYSPFWRALYERMPPPRPMPAPYRIEAPERWPESGRIGDLLPPPLGLDGFSGHWQPGEEGARDALVAFAERAPVYSIRRDFPSDDATSRLSPHLHFGELSPATAWHAVGAHKFRKELAWRDFAQGAMLAAPDIGTANGRVEFDAFPWRTGAAAERDFAAWAGGRTGWPIVDAGMRELRATGWMHNRVRMLAASFLVKHLLIDWRRGAGWFRERLVDADYGNNSLNWQWVAGTGIDSSPFRRIMAPLVQSQKFEAAGYIRRWVPELAALPDADIHDPGGAPGYPDRIVGHREARERALEAWARRG